MTATSPYWIPSNLATEVYAAVHSASTPLMLFGSFARGDASEHSDIDVLELSERRRRPYKSGRINVSVYDKPTLSRMAERGSLFVLHLRLEGKILRDRVHALQHCLDKYQSPTTYGPFRSALREIANLLDVDQKQYEHRWRAYNELAMYIIRSELYARLVEAGEPLFNVQAVEKRIGREDVSRVFRLKDSVALNYNLFCESKAVISDLLATKLENPFGSAEALITNLGDKNPLLVAFGLRLLGREKFELSYDLLTAPPFA